MKFPQLLRCAGHLGCGVGHLHRACSQRHSLVSGVHHEIMVDLPSTSHMAVTHSTPRTCCRYEGANMMPLSAQRPACCCFWILDAVRLQRRLLDAAAITAVQQWPPHDQTVRSS